MRLTDHPNLTYAVSTTDDGNMSYLRGEPQTVLANRLRFLRQNNININNVVTLNLVHGTNILTVGHQDTGNTLLTTQNQLKEADGLITNEPNVYLFILTADCHAIALFDPDHQAIGLIHAGRAGLDRGILTKAIKKMSAQFGTKPSDLLVRFSPSIGPCCYIKADIKQKDNPKWQPYLSHEADHFRIDIWRFAEDQLLAAGILKRNLDNPRLCTYHNNQYFSHREAENKHLAHDYRFATVLGLNL